MVFLCSASGYTRIFFDCFFVAMESVQSESARMEAGKKIGGSFGLGAWVVLIENQDFFSVSVEGALGKSGSGPCELVSAGSHRSALISLVKSFQ